MTYFIARLLVLFTATLAVASHAQPVAKPRPRQNESDPRFSLGPGRIAGEPFKLAIANDADFDAISVAGEGVVKSDVAKFLIDNRTSTPKIYFINANFNGGPPDAVRFHYDFARTYLAARMDSDTFNNSTYFTNDLGAKKFIAGTLQKYDGFYGVQFYPQDHIAEQSILFALRIVREAFNISDAKLNFVSFGLQQSTRLVIDDLRRLNVEVIGLDKIFGSLKYIAMNQGEAWGYLRLDADKKDLAPTDIPVFKELPLDLSVVAGVITTVVQDAGSHVNLKSKERGTPDMVLRDETRLRQISDRWADKPVHLIVRAADFEIQPSTDDEVRAHANRGQNRPWVSFRTEPSTELKSYDQMAHVPRVSQTIPDKYIFGGKAAKLGFLAHRDILGEGSRQQRALGYRLTPLGFGIPISYYFSLIDANPELKAKIQNFSEHEMSRAGKSPLAGAEKAAALKAIQELFYKARVPHDLAERIESNIQTLRADIERVYPGAKLKKIKLRSSANAEDVEDFDGAGLHDSFSAKLKNGIGEAGGSCTVESGADDDENSGGGVTTKQNVNPQTPLCALKAVYASLWNKRAVEERSFAHIDHLSAGMGIAVNPTYKFLEDTAHGVQEIANGVLITRILAAGQIYGYQISLNDAENLVTNPTPGTQSEITLATFIGNEKPSYTITQFARTKRDAPVRTEPIVPKEVYDTIVNMARAVETGYCHAVPEYYPQECQWVVSDFEKPKSLDMEFKIYSNGHVLMKQTREFSGR